MENKLKFKTSINCMGCVSKVNKMLDELLGENNWNVDVNNPDKVLYVNTDVIKSEIIIEKLASFGFKSEVL